MDEKYKMFLAWRKRPRMVVYPDHTCNMWNEWRMSSPFSILSQDKEKGVVNETIFREIVDWVQFDQEFTERSQLVSAIFPDYKDQQIAQKVFEAMDKIGMSQLQITNASSGAIRASLIETLIKQVEIGK